MLCGLSAWAQKWLHREGCCARLLAEIASGAVAVVRNPDLSFIFKIRPKSSGKRQSSSSGLEVPRRLVVVRTVSPAVRLLQVAAPLGNVWSATQNGVRSWTSFVCGR